MDRGQLLSIDELENIYQELGNRAVLAERDVKNILRALVDNKELEQTDVEEILKVDYINMS